MYKIDPHLRANKGTSSERTKDSDPRVQGQAKKAEKVYTSIAGDLAILSVLVAKNLANRAQIYIHKKTSGYQPLNQ